MTFGLHRPAALLALLLATTALPGCQSIPLFAAPEENRGHAVADYQLAEVIVGTHTRADVQALLGTPTTTGTFDDDNWYYISAVTRLRPFRTPGLEDQHVVIVAFNEQGVVQEVKTLDRSAGRRVAVVQRQTPSPGTERTLMQALLGNIGRLGAGPGASGATAAPGAQGSGR
jgi:outer membrane protein assembly factor BamE (lipoprotein component of BamABCDE complex)